MRKPKLRELKEAVLAIFRGPYTTKFPAVEHVPPDGFRGRSEYFEEDCIGCMACAMVCPAIAIKVVDDTQAHPPKRTLELRFDKCIFCGQCELNCTTKTGIKLTQIYDLATLDRASCVQEIEHELILCEVCGQVVGTRKHLLWVAEKLGAKAYANPTLIVLADGAMKLTAKDAGRTAEPTLARNDMMRVMCPACRRTTVIHELWGE
ncbi:MAG: 4Fe-4S dicluster domain-containing protein [Candidatus Brocadiae bacterium]|nr:4Fe-4S dicluster domain-containing protein [Candidatus Brocadiia bacterium]